MLGVATPHVCSLLREVSDTMRSHGPGGHLSKSFARKEITIADVFIVLFDVVFREELTSAMLEDDAFEFHRKVIDELQSYSAYYLLKPVDFSGYLISLWSEDDNPSLLRLVNNLGPIQPLYIENDEVLGDCLENAKVPDVEYLKSYLAPFCALSDQRDTNHVPLMLMSHHDSQNPTPATDVAKLGVLLYPEGDQMTQEDVIRKLKLAADPETNGVYDQDADVVDEKELEEFPHPLILQAMHEGRQTWNTEKGPMYQAFGDDVNSLPNMMSFDMASLCLRVKIFLMDC